VLEVGYGITYRFSKYFVWECVSSSSFCAPVFKNETNNTMNTKNSMMMKTKKKETEEKEKDHDVEKYDDDDKQQN
jgi:hypothetical protein